LLVVWGEEIQMIRLRKDVFRARERVGHHQRVSLQGHGSLRAVLDSLGHSTGRYWSIFNRSKAYENENIQLNYYVQMVVVGWVAW
jgi:hypothetical protein